MSENNNQIVGELINSYKSSAVANERAYNLLEIHYNQLQKQYKDLQERHENLEKKYKSLRLRSEPEPSESSDTVKDTQTE